MNVSHLTNSIRINELPDQIQVSPPLQLQELPDEILASIADLLPNTDLKNFLLTNHTFTRIVFQQDRKLKVRLANLKEKTKLVDDFLVVLAKLLSNKPRDIDGPQKALEVFDTFKSKEEGAEMYNDEACVNLTSLRAKLSHANNSNEIDKCLSNARQVAYKIENFKDKINSCIRIDAFFSKDYPDAAKKHLEELGDNVVKSFQELTNQMREAYTFLQQTNSLQYHQLYQIRVRLTEIKNLQLELNKTMKMIIKIDTMIRIIDLSSKDLKKLSSSGFREIEEQFPNLMKHEWNQQQRLFLLAEYTRDVFWKKIKPYGPINASCLHLFSKALPGK